MLLRNLQGGRFYWDTAYLHQKSNIVKQHRGRKILYITFQLYSQQYRLYYLLLLSDSVLQCCFALWTKNHKIMYMHSFVINKKCQVASFNLGHSV